MKFFYEYRTKDNAVHSGVVSASSRDDAYAVLKRSGIKPSRLSDAPGFINKLFGKGKRWMLIGALGTLCLVLCSVACRFFRSARESRARLNDARGVVQEAQSSMLIFDSPTRRQIIGDAAVIEEGVRTGWATVFADEGDRFLASFSIPGEYPAIRSTTVDAIERVLDSSRHSSRSSLGIESRQIVSIVGGMKSELRDFISAGGSIRQYGQLLVKRQEEEIGYRERAKTEYERAVAEKIPDAGLDVLRNQLNESLRKIGVKPLVKPREDF